MRKMLIIGLVLMISTLVLVSCSNNTLTAEERIKVAIEVLKEYKSRKSNLTDSLSVNREIDSLLTIQYATVSDPIKVSDARDLHQNYLERSPIRHNGRVVHSLLVDKDDLASLALHGKNGVRIYFMNRSDSISLVLVPVAMDGTNILEDPTSRDTYLVNKLDPCPDACIEDPGGRGKINHESDLNYNTTRKLWLKPNKGTSGRLWVNAEDILQ